MITDIKTRFLAKVEIEPITECWLWTRTKNKDGYGRFQPHKGAKFTFTHRFSYELHYGSIPQGALVLHQCDKPACVNPAHLFLGTQAENIADKVMKERQARGSLNGQAKLTEQDVVTIRASKGVKRTELARIFGVHEAHITSIRNRRVWAHLK